MRRLLKRPIRLDTMHGKRLKRRLDLKDGDVTPTQPRYVWRVECFPRPHYMVEFSVKGLPAAADVLWLRKARDAGECRRWCRAEKVRCIVDRFELRQCEICKRYLIGRQATDRRLAIEQAEECGVPRTSLPCDDMCLERGK